PLELPRLREVLDRFGMRSGTASAAAGGSVSPLVAAASAVVQASPVDLEQLRTLVGDDRAFLRELCETFVSSSSRIVEELGRAISDGDRAVLSGLAHKLKGGSASVCATELAKLAAALEKDAKDKPFEELEHSLASLRRAFDEAAEYVATEIAA